MFHALKTAALILTAGLIAAGSAQARPATPAAAVKLWRLDCGSFTAPTDNFSDIFGHPGQRGAYVDSCYLVRHGKDVMLWDAGLPRALIGRRADPSLPIRMTLIRSVTDQLAALGLKPSDVTVLGISHNHSDHTGQAADFPNARLLMAGVDFEALTHTPPPFFTDPASLSPWLAGDGRKELVSGDHDVFGDGTVVMVALPGHTAGNHGLLVRLAHRRPVLISGDAIHSAAQLKTRAVSPFNASRSDSLASIDRMIGIMRATHATLVTEHDPASVAKLPVFPAAAD
ncbi:N-acyl homoserine lactonase family protein [Labrys monachus]|uniref:Glyoxylase-like metal-dependent hydrolase (Beta-lactamase superfamily II) n=1 Tax=Labrys monachus TaxID=217067 RepID=A0ABU0F7X1_9HYPH|nr:N-acyl homoserine lactonase family protein [Labrys monachus]MDQ0390713.1 glyoxylase-like metal-dependent hydrolase (beta-lactamase superfamily II) [Labrys monachus]